MVKIYILNYYNIKGALLQVYFVKEKTGGPTAPTKIFFYNRRYKKYCFGQLAVV